jgi:hypothetical protein
MPLQTSGQITLDNVQGEFGGSNPIGINEYYRGGGIVPNSSVNNSIPTSGQIQLDDFYGGASLTADNNVSFVVQQYGTGSGKISFTVRGSNGSMSDGTLVTNNLNSFTVDDINKIYPDSTNIFELTISFSGTANGYNAYTTGLVRGVSCNGVNYPFAVPLSNTQTSLGVPGANATTIESLFANNVGNSLTFTFTY